MAITISTSIVAEQIAAPAAPGAAKGTLYLDSTGTLFRAITGAGSPDTLALLAATQTLTNKTLTSPVIGTPSFTGSATSNLDMGSFKITGLAAPTLAGDAVTKTYADAISTGVLWKAAVRLATTAALPAVTAAGSGIGKTLTANAVGILTVDTKAAVLNDRILVKDQATAADNGIYKMTTEGTAGVAFVLTRATDADETAEVKSGMAVFITDGAAAGNLDLGFILTTTGTITVDTTAQTFSQFTGLGDVVAGAGLTKTGNTIDVIAVANGGITVNPDSVQVDTTGTFTPTWTGAHTFNASVTIGAATTLTVSGKLSSALTPSTDNTFALGTAAARYSDAVSAQFRVFALAADANASAMLSSNSLQFGAGGATALDVQLSRGAADRLDLATGDSLNLVSGTFTIGGKQLFTNAGDIASTILPAVDITQSLGSGAKRFLQVFAQTVTTGDLVMKSEARGAQWRFIEHATSIEVVNEITGKHYTLALKNKRGNKA